MLLSVLLLIEKGEIIDGRVYLDGALKSVYKQLLAAVFPAWPFRADPRYPFRHLANDQVWRLVPSDEHESDLAALLVAGGKARNVMKHVACARLDTTLFATLAASRSARTTAADAVIATWLPSLARTVFYGFLSATPQPPVTAAAHAEAWSERALEEHLERHWRRTPFASRGVALSTVEKWGRPGRQVLTDVNAIDLLGFEQASRTWWVFELKKGRPDDSVVGQIARYIAKIREDVDSRGELVRGAIIAKDVSEKLRYSARSVANLELWRYRLPDVTLERV